MAKRKSSLDRLQEKQLAERPVSKSSFSSPTRRPRIHCKADQKAGFYIKRAVNSWPAISQAVRRALLIHERTCPECGHGVQTRKVARKSKGFVVLYTCEDKSCGFHSKSPIDPRVTV